MKKINYIKFAIDIVMAIIFVLLFNKRVLGGLTFHEIAGLAIAVIFLTHVLLNLQWVKRVTLKLFDKSLPGKTRFGYALNLSLLITMTFIMVSGILVSHVVFPTINVANENWFKITHISVSFFTLVLVAVHVGLHWKWVVQVWKKIFNLKKSGAALAWVARVAAVGMLLFGSYEMYTTNFLTRVASVTSVFSMSSMPAGGEGRMQPGSGERPQFGNGERPPGEMRGGMKGGQGQSASVMNVLATYFSIMSVFIVLIYYIEKLFRRRKKVTATQGV